MSLCYIRICNNLYIAVLYIYISLFTGWRHKLLWHCCWCSVHNLPRLCTWNINRFNERIWLYTKKKARSRRYPHRNYYGYRLHRWHSPSTKYAYSSRIPFTWSGADKMEYMCFNQKGDISTLNSGSLKLVDKFTYFGSSIYSTENEINLSLAKTWTAIAWWSIMWKSNLTDKIKRNFFQAAVVSILLYGYTTWMLTKLWTILNKSWK